MKRKPIVLALVAAFGALVVCGVLVIAAGAVAPRVLGAGPDGIDLRPVPGDIEPEAALPQRIADYERGECHSVTTFHGLALGPAAVEAVYTGPGGSARVVAARLGSYHDAAAAVSELAGQLENAGVLGSRRLLAEEPFEGWWSASGKRNFAYWHASDWNTDQRGFVWQSGNWCFIVAANDPVARRDVSLEFSY